MIPSGNFFFFAFFESCDMPANRVLAHAQHLGDVPEHLIAVRHAAVVGQVSSLVPPVTGAV